MKVSINLLCSTQKILQQTLNDRWLCVVGRDKMRLLTAETVTWELNLQL